METEECTMLETAEAVETLQTMTLTLNVNGQEWSGSVPVEEVLLDCLRYRVGLTGTKRSCQSQVCGACTVLVDDQPVSSCSYFAFEASGKAVLTVEGLATGEHLSALQEAFLRNGAAQCGYCTSGQLMAGTALLLVNQAPTYDEIAEWLSGNVCRCGCYPAIATSIQEAAEQVRGLTPERV
jgi:aerobic-type carbon monoxide dehydrogenase small subunit (CoxS/CutS family)